MEQVTKNAAQGKAEIEQQAEEKGRVCEVLWKARDQSKIVLMRDVGSFSIICFLGRSAGL